MKLLRPSRVLGAASLSAAAALAIALPAFADTEPTGAGAEEEPAADTGTTTPDADESDAGRPDDPGEGPGDTSDNVVGESSGDAVRTAGRTDREDRRKLGDRTLREGMRGRDVRRLQKLLRHLNFIVKVDGRYERDTKRQVRRYDIWKEKRVNGVVHRQQAERMRKLERRGARYRAHVFPVRGPHSYGGAGSRFGAPRSGHTHQGQDIAAASGTKLVAVHEGKVDTVQYQAGGAGHYVVIRGRDDTDSVYMHMLKEARVTPGQRVLAGQMIGRVGSTGSSTGPHLHFELWTPHWFAGGVAFDPLRKLLKWDR
jgi:murein DD-endopeptidase MepM/ murein hydrolase activator NlpD